MTIEELLALEEIRSLRIGYAAHLDSQDLDRLVDIFADDAICDFGEYGTWNGREEIGLNYQSIMRQIGEPFDAIHIVTNPWIVLSGPTSAQGRWYLTDILTRQRPVTQMSTRGGHDNPLLWLGIYEDEYRKADGAWKIAKAKLHFLWPTRDYAGLSASVAPAAAEPAQVRS